MSYCNDDKCSDSVKCTGSYGKGFKIDCGGQGIVGEGIYKDVEGSQQHWFSVSGSLNSPKDGGSTNIGSIGGALADFEAAMKTHKWGQKGQILYINSRLCILARGVAVFILLKQVQIGLNLENAYSVTR